MENALPTQIIVLMGALAILIHMTYATIRYRYYWNMAIIPISYILHVVVFYSLIVYARLQGTVLSVLFGIPRLSENWSSILRLHSLVTVMLMFLLCSKFIRMRK
jgi:uncharacterized membrane protein